MTPDREKVARDAAREIARGTRHSPIPDRCACGRAGVGYVPTGEDAHVRTGADMRALGRMPELRPVCARCYGEIVAGVRRA